MKSFECVCSNTIFFENTQCLSCRRELGWCPACHSMTSLEPVTTLDPVTPGAGTEDLSESDSVDSDPSESNPIKSDPATARKFRCGKPGCGALLKKCQNYAVERVCNRCCLVADNSAKADPFCDYCRFNDTIPNLSLPSHREKWSRLEAAKRRLLYTLDLLHLPYGSQRDGFDPPLSFDFKADVVKPGRWWWAMGKEERVYTGHAGGKITINVREADTVELEKSRVHFEEAHRTVVGHFRHEIAHYYWQMLVQGQCEPECKAAFGDHENPSYAEAQQKYYTNGPPSHWRARFVSAYATMHPWEDFAETFATYLDMVSVLDTALNMGISDSCDPTQAKLPRMVETYIRLGVVLNEMNRAMGLIDLVPEIFAPPIVEKMQFVHNLLRGAAQHQQTDAVESRA
ncbi:MAG: putative zinc-binding metallopeptidase [Rhodopirellula sp.]|nr:putative zinc-binding metallopeptidase [Rhodopirellula sp.]